ncbi:hypothetical protein ABVK25_009569 [Lepraria finkii]|uniref:Uncharacterized protein n=1 Tax=Lepraria finkii TaxID=1340010 RepID=A0ABR4AYI8_9LECA
MIDKHPSPSGKYNCSSAKSSQTQVQASLSMALVVCLSLAGNIDEVRAVVDNLKLCSYLANVGDAKTLIIHPWVPTHQQLPDEGKIKGGVTPISSVSRSAWKIPRTSSMISSRRL